MMFFSYFYSAVMFVAAWIVQYGANVRLFDHEGHNCLYYARSAGSNDCVEILLANGCPDNPTLPRRRKPDAASSDAFNKLPSSNI